MEKINFTKLEDQFNKFVKNRVSVVYKGKFTLSPVLISCFDFNIMTNLVIICDYDKGKEVLNFYKDDVGEINVHEDDTSILIKFVDDGYMIISLAEAEDEDEDNF